ncbi:serine/threonine-protein kinase PLK4 isoform X1 [Maniola jurtina]|uniref:serine/threonine-protein kinase PLK4 isoform X1 n=1 Tax=Maniola jurtina TaxID=191418 RepID=UPI001E687C70|nr:serine/threonine-protein kinase PLK4 isoform X1 [Maniola jurtina]XP_045783525.1 serine/threonine-protein kinase PLK4 isoform X1 [Maniola jurtina]
MFGEKIEDYEILEHLGKGGFAHVYRARCRKTSLFVAIKMIDKALMANAGMIGRVRQEVTIHSRLKHPAILELYTFFEDAHYVYLVLELAHNGELAKHFKLGTCGLSEKAAADIFRQVFSGVLYLHTHNIIHRDLSLNNLLLTKDLNVKIADFGLATQLNGPDEKHVTMCGTPNYISPEVASRELHGLPADVWGLGCMLYTLLVGSPPFHTKHVKTTLNKVINADYKIPGELSVQAQDLLQKLLCKDPSTRITLKGILEHPFLNNCFTNNPKQDFSRDSGFLTTLHSTQHSQKPRIDEKSDTQSALFIDLNHLNKGTAASSKCYEQNTYNLFNLRQQNDYVHTGNEHLKLFDNNQNKMHMVAHKQDNPCDSACLPENIKILSTTKKNCNIPNLSEDKENLSKACITTSNSLSVPPLCAERLPTISHRTRNAILKIEPCGVIVEFIKRKGKDREEKIVEICKISKDGMKIIIHSVDKEKDKVLGVEYNPKPEEIFSYHNLPQKHWKKYLYAARFVDLVKAKTPKITIYTSLAKCQLMENGTDIEMFFYNGEKITSTAAEGLKVIDKSLKIHQNPGSLVPDLKYLTDHFEECSNRLNRIQNALSCISDECFPLIIGKRPIQTASNVIPQNVATPSVQGFAERNFNTPLFNNLGSFHRTTTCSSRSPSENNGHY